MDWVHPSEFLAQKSVMHHCIGRLFPNAWSSVIHTIFKLHAALSIIFIRMRLLSIREWGVLRDRKLSDSFQDARRCQSWLSTLMRHARSSDTSCGPTISPRALLLWCGLGLSNCSHVVGRYIFISNFFCYFFFLDSLLFQCFRMNSEITPRPTRPACRFYVKIII